MQYIILSVDRLYCQRRSRKTGLTGAPAGFTPLPPPVLCLSLFLFFPSTLPQCLPLN